MPVPEWEKHFSEFSEKLIERLKAGHKEYGDGSFNKPVTALVDELIEELYDICGWSFVALAHLKDVRHLAEHIEERLGLLEVWDHRGDPDFHTRVEDYVNRREED